MPTMPAPFWTQSAARAAVRAADGVNRADHGLRAIATVIGDATMCRKCDGAGYVPRPDYGWDDDKIIKCTRCGGEGLEPPE